MVELYLYSTAHKSDSTDYNIFGGFPRPSLFPDLLPQPVGGFTYNILRGLLLIRNKLRCPRSPQYYIYYSAGATPRRPLITQLDMQQQDTELTTGGEGSSGPAPPPPDVTTPPVNGEPAEPPEEVGERGGGDPEEATTHHSSGYASSDSSGVGGGPAAATTPLSEGTPPIAAQQQLPAAAVLPVSIQSDPQQSAFRPAMPAQQVCVCSLSGTLGTKA